MLQQELQAAQSRARSSSSARSSWSLSIRARRLLVASRRVQSVTRSNLARVRIAITSNECGEHLVACSLLGVVGLESGHCRYFFNQRLELRQLV